MRPDRNGARGSLAAALLIAGVFAALVVPAALSGRGGTSEASDQDLYHLPIVRAMVEQWPRIDVVHYPSATAPGYHVFLATVARIVGDDPATLQLVNALVGVALALAIFATTRRTAPPAIAVALALPAIFSSYVLGGAIWLTTDNAALLWVVLAVGAASLARPTPARLLAAGGFAALAACIRQIHVWPAGVIIAAGLLPVSRRREGGGADAGRGQRARRAVAAVLAAAAPLSVVGAFALAWGGLTPPAYRSLHAAGINPATPAAALALLGAFGVFFLPAALPWRPAPQRRRRDIALGLTIAAAALACALAVPTDYDMESGRWGGGLWSAVRVAPSLGGRSLLLAPLAVAGALVLALLGRAAAARGRGRAATLVLVALAGFVAAQSFNTQCWQRYLEPMLLIALAWLGGLAASGGDGGVAAPPPRWWWAGPVLLGGVQLGVAAVGLYGRMLAGGAGP